MILEKQGYSYNDLTIIPTRVSQIKSRSEVNPFVYNKMLPLFTAPMSTVVCLENINIWEKNGVYTIIPRNIDIETRIEYLAEEYWVALSIKEAKEIFLENEWYGRYSNVGYICIDVANGHMRQLIDLCKEIKAQYPAVSIMTGNIANPQTLLDYENAGIDYVRCSIGSGAGCITAPNTSVHYPIASLINECRILKNTYGLKINIVADGGIRNYGDVIKALALGADYVMIGSLFAGLLESAAEFDTSDENHKYHFYEWSTEKKVEQLYYIFDENLDEQFKRDFISKWAFTKVFYGMSTKKAQKMIKSDAEIKTSEGTHKKLHVRNTINQWTENMEAYLRSAMSYCNSKDLKDFIGKQTLIPNSPAEIQAVNK